MGVPVVGLAIGRRPANVGDDRADPDGREAQLLDVVELLDQRLVCPAAVLAVVDVAGGGRIGRPCEAVGNDLPSEQAEEGSGQTPCERRPKLVPKDGTASEGRTW